MYEMQTATIDEAGTRLAYLDSEAPSSDTYTTLVVVHGYSYHARNFSRLFPIAKDYNLRVIALNRRDYVGSTPFSDDELAAVNNGDESAHLAFLQARGREVARFLAWIIREKKIPIPKASAGGREGGLALMGWSFGNLTTLAFLRHLQAYPKEVIETITPYLRTFFIYETGSGTLGYPNPEGGYHPLYDTTIPARMRGIYFGTWVSSYYKHPYYSTTDNRERSISSLQIRVPEKSQVYRPCTLDTIKPQELIDCTDNAPATRSDLLPISREVKYEQVQSSLLLDYTSPFSKDSSELNNASGSRLLPDVKVCDLYCDASTWSIPWGVWELEKDLERWKEEGREIRPIHFLRVQGGNHFVHWDDPDLFLKFVKDGIMH